MNAIQQLISDTSALVSERSEDTMPELKKIMEGFRGRHQDAELEKQLILSLIAKSEGVIIGERISGNQAFGTELFLGRKEETEIPVVIKFYTGGLTSLLGEYVTQQDKYFKVERDALKVATETNKERYPENRLFPTLHAATTKDGIHALVLEYVEGKKGAEVFENAVRNNSPFSENQLLKFLETGLKALDCLATNNIIHRDISPRNFIFQEDGSVTLLDLNTAKSTGATNITILEPENFYPPDAYTLHPSPSVDLHALGVIALCLFTGKNQYDLPQDVTSSVSFDKLIIPVKYKVFLEKLCAKDPKIRYQSADEALKELENIINASPREGTTVLDNSKEPGVAGIQSFRRVNIFEKIKFNLFKKLVNSNNQQIQKLAIKEVSKFADTPVAGEALKILENFIKDEKNRDIEDLAVDELSKFANSKVAKEALVVFGNYVNSDCNWYTINSFINFINLTELEDTIPILVTIINNPRQSCVHLALDELVKLSNSQSAYARDAFTAVGKLADKNSHRKFEAIRALSNYPESPYAREAIEILGKNVNDSQSVFRQIAIESLSEFASSVYSNDALEILCNLVNDESKDVRITLAKALSKFNQEVNGRIAIVALSALTKDGLDHVRIASVEALSKFNKPEFAKEVLEIFGKLAQDSNKEIRSSLPEAIKAFSNTNNSEEALIILAKLLQDKDRYLLKYPAAALATFANGPYSQQAIDILKDRLENCDPKHIESILRGVNETPGVQDSLVNQMNPNTIQKFSNDSNPIVRDFASRTLQLKL